MTTAEIMYRTGTPEDGAAMLLIHTRAIELVAVREYGEEMARTEMWNRRLELHLLFPISHVFRNSHPAMAKM